MRNKLFLLVAGAAMLTMSSCFCSYPAMYGPGTRVGMYGHYGPRCRPHHSGHWGGGYRQMPYQRPGGGYSGTYGPRR